MDNRAQSLGIAHLYLALLAGTFVIWIVQMVTTPVLNHARNATASTQANTATGWFETFVTYLPGIFLLIGFFGLIVLAVYLNGIRQ